MPTYNHGIYIQEQATSLVPTIEVSAGLPVVIGTAPLHLVNAPAAELPHAAAAAVVCRELKMSGYSCPEDFSLITFDNSVDNVFGLTLTHLHLYPRDLGGRAAQRIYQMMTSTQPDGPFKIVLPLKLTVGNSVRARGDDRQQHR